MRFSLGLLASLPLLANAIPSIWPKPSSLAYGTSVTNLSNKFEVVDVLSTFNDNVKESLARYDPLFFPHSIDESRISISLMISVANPSSDLQLESDESYILACSDDEISIV